MQIIDAVRMTAAVAEMAIKRTVYPNTKTWTGKTKTNR